MKKVFKIGIPVLLVLAVAVGGFFAVRYRTRSLFDIVGMKREDITKVELYNDYGWMRSPCFEAEEQEDIDRVLNMIDVKYRFSEKLDPQIEGCLQHTIVLTAGDKKAIVSFGSDSIWYDFTIYHTVSENMDEAVLEALGSASSGDGTF